MKCWLIFLCLSLPLLPVEAAGTKKTGFTVPVRYEGGTLPLRQQRVRATLAEDELIFVHGNQRYAIPLRNITAVSYGTEVHNRFGASVLGVVPLMHLEKAESYHVGLTWTGNQAGEQASKSDAVFKMSNGEYRDFVAALERLTGRKAVNTGRVPTVVRYEL